MDEIIDQTIPGDSSNDSLIKVTGMYKDWFLDYASYVILERAVPAIEDGLKPVQTTYSSLNEGFGRWTL